MTKNITILLLLFAVTVTLSCKKSSFDPGKTAAVNASNGWWVTYSVNGAPYYGPVFFSTYNVSANTTDSLWIDDLEQFWQFKGKVALDYTNLTFSNPSCINEYYSSDAKVANGKIMPKAGHSKSGVVTDSIYFEIQFSDDSPAYGTTFQVSGTARTGFIEDDY